MKKNLLFPAAVSRTLKTVAAAATLSLLLPWQEAAAQTPVLVRWPLTRNNQDSVSVRSAGVTPGTPTFRGFVLSNGQANGQSDSHPPYSTNGQAFGVLADGSNGSTQIPGGPRRTYYEQFSITATQALRVDSLVFNIKVANSANGTMALSYSLNGFQTDSMSFANGKGPVIVGSSSANSSAGGILPATNNGSFGTATATQPAANPAFIPQFNAANPKSDFHFAFTGTSSGLTLAAGQTLTVRMYFRVGSNTANRYFLLRDVTIKSTQAYTPYLATTPRSKQLLAAYPNPTQERLTISHPAAKAGATVTVYELTGRKVATFATQTGTLNTDLNLASLTRGLYMVEFNDGVERITGKIVKE